MRQLDLSDEECDALAQHLRDHIGGTRYRLAPALRPLKAILAKLDPQPEPVVSPWLSNRSPTAILCLRVNASDA